MPRLKYYAAALSAAVIWGFFSITLRHLKAYPPEQILYYRVFTSLLIVWIIIAFRRSRVRSDRREYALLDAASRRKAILLTLFAGVLITGNWFTFIYAVNHVSLQSASFAYMICPLLTALGGFLLLKETLTRLKFVAVGIAFVSIALLARGSARDVTWAITIALLYSGYLLIQRVVRNFDRLNMLGVHLLIASLLILPAFFLHFTSFPATIDFWLSIFLIAVVFTIIPLFLSLYSLNGIPSSTLGIIIYVNPLISFTVAFCYFQERISVLQLLAYSLLLVAVVVFNWEVLKRSIGNWTEKPGDEQRAIKNSY